MQDEEGQRVELLADIDRPGGWLLLMDRIRQSYVDLDDPSYLDFEYVQAFADVIDALPAGPLAVTHVGGGALTLARYIATSRPGSPQIVLEPDEQVTALVRAKLPLPRGHKVRVRPVEGRAGLVALKDASADVVVVDAFAGGRVPASLTTAEFFADVARVLRPDGVVLANLPDGGPGFGAGHWYIRRAATAARDVLPEALLRADPAVFKGRRFGNITLAASRAELPVTAVVRTAAAAPFPQRVLAGDELDRFVDRAAPFTDADPQRSPSPPDELWRVV
jgi:SAM-dependent methyltransferase